MSRQFFIYVMTNKRNGTLYIGVTNDLQRRVYEHRQGLVEGFPSRYGLKMIAGGAAALVHGVFPFLFETTGSRITRELNATLDKARAQPAARERESA